MNLQNITRHIQRRPCGAMCAVVRAQWSGFWVVFCGLWVGSLSCGLWYACFGLRAVALQAMVCAQWSMNFRQVRFSHARFGKSSKNLRFETLLSFEFLADNLKNQPEAQGACIRVIKRLQHNSGLKSFTNADRMGFE